MANFSRINIISTLCFIVFVAESTIFARSLTPIKKPEEFNEHLSTYLKIDERVIEKTTLLPLKNAKVVIANYQLIRNDFKNLLNLKNNEIDQWLIKNFAFIAKTQKDAAIQVNSPIETMEDDDEKAIIGYRPWSHGRAILMPAEGVDFLVDVKGIGAKNPKNEDHANGLVSLGEAIREFTWEQGINIILKDFLNLDHTVVGTYAIIDPGFYICWDDPGQCKDKSRAALYIRQSHSRHISFKSGERGTGWLTHNQRYVLARLMGLFGVDTGIPNNIQGTTDADLFDFGHYIVAENKVIAIAGGFEVEVKVNPDLALPFKNWGYEKEALLKRNDLQNTGAELRLLRWVISRYDNPWNWAHDTADYFVKNSENQYQKARQAVDDFVNKTFIDPLVKKAADYKKNPALVKIVNNALYDNIIHFPTDIRLKDDLVQENVKIKEAEGDTEANLYLQDQDSPYNQKSQRKKTTVYDNPTYILGQTYVGLNTETIRHFFLSRDSDPTAACKYLYNSKFTYGSFSNSGPVEKSAAESQKGVKVVKISFSSQEKTHVNLTFLARTPDPNTGSIVNRMTCFDD